MRGYDFTNDGSLLSQRISMKMIEYFISNVWLNEQT